MHAPILSAGCDREAAAQAMTRQIHLAREALLHASSLIVTLGTTRVFRHRQQGMVVANCHRLPSSSFREETLSLDQCTDDLESLVSMVRTVNPDIHIIFGPRGQDVSDVSSPGLPPHGRSLSSGNGRGGCGNALREGTDRRGLYGCRRLWRRQRDAPTTDCRWVRRG